MADDDKVKAATVPRIGEMIEAEKGIKYETYSGDQKLGRTADKPYNGMEAAVAAIINNDGIADAVYGLLKKQADLRTDAVAQDMKAVLAGKKLDGLAGVPMVNGTVKVGALFMSDAPTENDIRIQDKDAPPGKLDADLAKLAKAAGVLKDPAWLVAEGASNISNAIRDAEINANGQLLSDKQKKILRDGVKAEQQLEHDLVTGTVVSGGKKEKLERQVEAAMDTAAGAAGIKLDDPSYKHYRGAMHTGIDAGLEAIKTLHEAGVQPAQGEGKSHTPIIKREPRGHSPE